MIRIEETLVIDVIGEVDVYTARTLSQELDPRVGYFDRIVLDLTRVEMICSSGLGVVMAAHRRMRASGGSLTLVAEPGGGVHRLLDIVGIVRGSGVPHIYDSVAEALEAARGDAESSG